jgi:hypothetical protein
MREDGFWRSRVGTGVVGELGVTVLYGAVEPAQVPDTQVLRTTSLVRSHTPLGDLGMVSKREGFSANARIFVASLIILGDGHNSGTAFLFRHPQTWSGDESGRSAGPRGCTGLVDSGMKSSSPSAGTNKTPDLRNEPLMDVSSSNRGCCFFKVCRIRAARKCEMPAAGR